MDGGGKRKKNRRAKTMSANIREKTLSKEYESAEEHQKKADYDPFPLKSRNTSHASRDKVCAKESHEEIPLQQMRVSRFPTNMRSSRRARFAQIL